MNMEFRGTSNKKLVDILKGAGVYEEGMEEEEMLQMAEAMKMSIIETCHQQDTDLEFLSLLSTNLHSSTLITPPQVPTSSGYDSPPSEPIYLTVQAVVHHPMDWSPPKNEGLSRNRKRSPTDNNPPLSEPGAKRSMRLRSTREETQEDRQQDEQPYNPDATPVSMNLRDVYDSDSWEEISLSFSGIGDTSSVDSIGEIPSGYMVSTSSVAISESSGSHEEASRDQMED